MNEERIYVIVPETVQVEVKPLTDFERVMAMGDPNNDPMIVVNPNDLTGIKSIHMESGRLMAQCVHIGRKLEHEIEAMGGGYKVRTTIVLSVRNTKELRKVTAEINETLEKIDPEMKHNYHCVQFHDSNPAFYDTYETVHTITCVGPVTEELRAKLESAIGYLELAR